MKICVGWVALWIACMTTTWAETNYVVMPGTLGVVPTTNYTNWATAATNIQDAVSVAVPGNTVLVSNGNYTLNAQVAFADLTIRSLSGRDATFINGNYSVTTNRAFQLAHRNALLDGFTITNCAADNGGAIYIQTDGRVVNCVLAFNQATNTGYNGKGGGAVCLDGGGWLTNCVISHNAAPNGTGGGVLLYKGGGMSNCLLTANSASNSSGYNGGGAAVYFDGAQTCLVTECVFSNNAARAAGGGLLFYKTSIGEMSGLINICAFINNRGTKGGGVYLFNGGVVSNCTITSNDGNGFYVKYKGWMEKCQVTGNRSDNSGGGICIVNGGGVVVNSTIRGNWTKLDGGGVNLSPNSILRNCLIADNEATNSARSGGGGYADRIGNEGGVLDACTVVSNKAAIGGGLYLLGTNNVVLNSVIYSNTATTSNDLYLASDPASNALAYNCTPVTLSGAGNITGYPVFMNPSGGNWRLAAASPCINAGTNQAWMDTAIDLFGQPRIRYGRADMGCYEYFLNVKINGIPIDRIKSVNGVSKNRIIRISE